MGEGRIAVSLAADELKEKVVSAIEKAGYTVSAEGQNNSSVGSI